MSQNSGRYSGNFETPVEFQHEISVKENVTEEGC
jgi:hypothetical protein